ncbi:DUF2184 domain-containing protein [bacterium]|nr:DUF2184 domain-containing protein [bacterium]
MYRFNDIKLMTREVDRISKRVYQEAFRQARLNFQDELFLDFQPLGQDEKTFEYTPKDRTYIFGANNVQPASCSSIPGDVEESGGDTVRGLTHLFESGYHLCEEECDRSSIEETIFNKEVLVATVLIRMLTRQMYEGMPHLMQYGLLNHPLIEVIQSPVTNDPGPEGCDGSDNCGSTKWEHKTPNEIAKMLRSAGRHFTNPQIIMSDNAYENSMFVMDETLINNGRYGALRYEIIEELLRKKSMPSLAGIIPTEELDNHKDFDHKDIAIVHDRGAMALTASPTMWKGADHDHKNVHVHRTIRTGGLRINYADAVKIIVGV